MRQFMCGFCLDVVEREDPQDYPQFCDACKIVRCQTCSSFIKARSLPVRFCYGCGTVNPETGAQFTGTDTFACVYVEDEWKRRNQGRSSEAIFTLATSLSADKKSRGTVTVVKRIDDDFEDVRELSEDEKNFVNNRCWKCQGMKEIEEPVCGHCEEGNIHSHCDDTWHKKVKCDACNGSGEYVQEPFLMVKHDNKSNFKEFTKQKFNEATRKG